MNDHSDDAPLLPGLKPVLELLASEPQRVDLVFCKKGLHGPEAREVQNLCRQNGVRFSLVDGAALDRLCRGPRQGRDAVAHQGVVARLAVTGFCGLEELLAAVPDAPLPLLLALDQVQDPGNVGTLCRTLYALGGAGLLLPRHNSAYLGPAALDAGLNSSILNAESSVSNAYDNYVSAYNTYERFRADLAAGTNSAIRSAQSALDSAEEAGLTIYGAGGAPGHNSLDAFADGMRLPAVLVLGNEDKGLRPGVAKRCAHMLRIPLARPFDSLNVAQAGAVLLGLAAAARSRGSVV